MENEVKLIRKKETKLQYKPNIKITISKLVDKLYENGINNIKKIEEEIKNEKL